MKTNDDREGLAWQVSVWDRISQIYLREVDQRFAQVVEGVIKRAVVAIPARSTAENAQ